MSTLTAYRHIVLNEQGVPVVAGTTTKVVEVVLDHLAGNDAGEIHRQYPYLTCSQIHSALAYYYDHQKEIDEDILRRRKLVEDFKAKAGPSPLREKLRQRGQQPLSDEIRNRVEFIPL